MRLSDRRQRQMGVVREMPSEIAAKTHYFATGDKPKTDSFSRRRS